MMSSTGRGGPHRRGIRPFETDAVDDGGIPPAGAVRHPGAAPGGGAANHRADDRRVRVDAGRVARRSGAAPHTSLEQLLWEIPGVEYLYSTSSPGQAMLVVRFLVGEDEDRALARLDQKLAANPGVLPAGSPAPVVAVRSISTTCRSWR